MPVPYPPQPVTLSNSEVTLLPMEMKYVEPLKEAVNDGQLWNLWYTFIPSPEQMEQWVEKALQEFDQKVSLPFVVQRNSDRKIVGSTRFMNIEKDVRRLEIGTTWYSKSTQRTSINTSCKLLLLKHAFEDLECVAVEFRTHRFNFASRKAIERLGAQLDGILRRHRFSSNGTIRDTVVYSIINDEWSNVKSHLEFMLTKKYL